jgi:hypothetical protein
MNIKKLNVLLEFGEKIEFTEEPELAFYKMIFRRLKSIVCLNSTKDCSSCSYTKKCIYYYLSGKDFTEMEVIPVVIKKNLFTKKIYYQEDKLYLNFLFLGRSINHMNFFSFIIKEFETKGVFKERCRFFIRSIKYTDIKYDNAKNIKGISILTPTNYNEDMFKREFNKVSYLNKEHEITNKEIKYRDIEYIPVLKEFGFKKRIFLEGRKVRYKGKVGNIYFNNGIKIDEFIYLLYVIGLGGLYSIGGGNFEFICDTVK